jgi:hypothetical protein
MYRSLYNLGKRTPMPIAQTAGLAPEPIWTTWIKEKSFPGIKIQPLDRRARSQ